MQVRQNIIIIMTLGILTFLLFACGTNNNQQSNKSKDPASYLAGSSMYSTYSTLNRPDANSEEWRCPSTANVLFQSDYHYTENNFVVCTHREDPQRFKIFSEQSTYQNICVYPLYKNSQNLFQLTSAPQCLTFLSNQAAARFTTININYMVIIDRQYTNQMNACLSSQTSCPPHSEGLVQ